MKPIRDLTDTLRMPADSHAGLFESAPGLGRRYWVGWGKGYDLLTDTPDTHRGRVLLLARYGPASTAEHGVESFDTLDDALGRVGDIVAALEG